MAELVTHLDEFTTCAICSDHLKSPRMLPCQHTFCVKCLDGHIRASADSSSDQSTFDCPVCKANLPVPENGADDFPLNQVIVKVQEAVTWKQRKKDQKVCELCNENNSEKICVECNKTICIQCIRIHDMLSNSANHSVYLTSELEAMSIEQICEFSPELCRSHQNEKVQFYCEHCDDVICIKCRLTTHHTAEHVCTDLCDKNAEWKAELDKCENELFNMEYHLAQEMSNIDAVKKSVHSQIDNFLVDLFEEKEKLITRITECYDVMGSKLCSISDADITGIDKEIENLKEKNELVQQMKKKSKFAQKFSSDSNLLKRMKILKNRMTDYQQNIMSFKSIALQKPEFVANERSHEKIRELVGEIHPGIGCQFL